MEKQEIEQLDMSEWCIVWENPNVAWLGRSTGANNTIPPNIVSFSEVYALTSNDVMMPGPNGAPQQARMTTISNLHSFNHAVPVMVHATAITSCRDMANGDLQELQKQIYRARDIAKKRRAQKLGLL